MHKAQAAALNAAQIAHFNKNPSNSAQNNESKNPTIKKMIFPFYR